ncbi:MAG: dTDP-glucose 4,6-dehydratase [PVC group bacterium]|nr:dTDP-glucose 4,6-dehydratase [PVC group bacterium]
MKILITGGLGFIGGNFIRYILKTYPKIYIVNLDKQTYAANRGNIKEFSAYSHYSFVKGDIADRKIVNKAMRGCSMVINFAAETHVDRSIEDADVFIKTNVFGVHTLLEAARKIKVKRFIQISTDEVYGSRLSGSFKESDRLGPNNPYSASKASADMLVRSYFKTYNMPVIIVRPTNNFGPYQFPEKVIPLFVTNLLENKKVPLYGDGKNIRDWLFVFDNCRAIDLVRRKGEIGEIYNVGAGNEVKNIELTQMILERLEKSPKHIKYVKDRLGHDRRYSLSSAKLRSLGFKPKYGFQQALIYTIDWYKDNQNWWKKLKRKSS